MTTEEKKEPIEWFCENCPIFKGKDSDPIDEGSELFKNVKLVHKEHIGWKKGRPKEKLTDGVRVDESKPISKETINEWNKVSKNSLNDSEFRFQLKTNWQIIKSNASDEDKDKAKIRINELEGLLYYSVTKFPSKELSKELETPWKVLKSKKGSGISKKDKEKAKIRINELERFGGLDVTDFDNYDQDEINLNHVSDFVLSQYHFMTINDKNRELYTYQDGVYRTGSDGIIDTEIETYYKDKSTIGFRKEVTAKIKIRTLTDREEIDKDADMLNLANGLFNITKGILMHHSPKHKSIIQWGAKYKKDAKCPKFFKFLNEVILEPKERITILEMMAELLWKTSTLTKSYFLLGSGSNGKSTLRNIILCLVGKNNNSELSLDDYNDKYRPAELAGKICNFPDEIDDTKISKTAKWKSITAKNSVLVEKKFGHPFSFTSYALNIMPCNRPPQIDDKSDGTYRRIVPIHFNQTFVSKLTKDLKNKGFKQIDEKFANSLLEDEEISGLFNVLVLSVRRLKKRGHLTFERSIDDIRSEWEMISDTNKEWINEILEVDENAFALKTDYYRSYVTFCKFKNYKADGLNTFYANFQREGAIETRRRISDKDKNPKHCFKGFWFKGTPKKEPDEENQTTLN